MFVQNSVESSHIWLLYWALELIPEFGRVLAGLRGQKETATVHEPLGLHQPVNV